MLPIAQKLYVGAQSDLCEMYKLFIQQCGQRYLLNKTHVVGTQKNHLNETVLLSTQNTCLNGWIRKLSHFYADNFCLTDPMMKQSITTQTRIKHKLQHTPMRRGQSTKTSSNIAKYIRNSTSKAVRLEWKAYFDWTKCRRKRCRSSVVF